MPLLEDKAKAGATNSFLPPATTADSAQRDVPGVIAPPPLIYLVGLGLGFALEALLPSASFPGWLSWPLGSALVLGGVVLAVSFIRAFRRAGTPVSPSEPATALITKARRRFRDRAKGAGSGKPGRSLDRTVGVHGSSGCAVAPLG
jgi:hypothetical protein